MAISIDPPLVVDLDGTLTPTDTLVETIIKAVRCSPFILLCIPIWMMKGRECLMEAVATRARISVEDLPYRLPLLDYLRKERQRGRTIVLATAAHHSIALRVASFLGLFDHVLATGAGHDFKGKEKLQAIREKVGPTFAYAGDSRTDVPIWRAAQAAVLVDVPGDMARAIRQEVQVEREFPGESGGLGMWIRALRIHQWLKNLLLFVPLLTAFSFFELGKLTSSIVAFLAFSVAASATYIVNDLWDLDNDRAHPRKRQRPFASARLPILKGLAVAACALLLAFVLAIFVSKTFFLMLLTYLVMTSAYSWMVKEYVLMDVLMLSQLYTLRILAGSVAIGTDTSDWLLAFSGFMFLSLALVKRCTELISLQGSGKSAASGRDYQTSDLVVLWPLGVGAALCAVVVFGLFISAPETQARYGTPRMLWLVAMGLIYWLARLWVKTSRGEMYDDPVVFAIKDRGSRITVIVMVTVMLAAHFLTITPLL